MAKYVQVLNGLVVNVWDSPPKVPIGEDGWMNAVDDIPVTSARQELGEWTYDLSVDPVIISREVKEIPFEERQSRLKHQNELEFTRFLEITVKQPLAYTQEDVLNNRQIARQNAETIDAAKNHDDLDAIQLTPIKLF